LQGPDGVVHGTHSILKVAANFYKDLSRNESRGGFRLENNLWCLNDMVNHEENLALEAPFSEKRG
jgi:hypothetical protein